MTAITSTGPLNRHEYYAFIEALLHAERIQLRSFEEALRQGVKAGHFFEGCLPIEIMAERGKDTLAFGPMRPGGTQRSTRRQAAFCRGAIKTG